MTDSFFCLDIGENLIKLVDAKLISNQLDIQTLAYVEGEMSFFSSEAEKIIENQTTRIEKLITSLKITKKNVSLVIPDAVTYSQILQMPRLNEKELISAIKYQADQFIPMPIDETNIDLEVLSENEKENSLLVLMVAAPKKIIERVQKVIELAGLIPESVENELSSTVRFFSSLYKNLSPKAQEGVCIINLAYNSTSLYYFNPQTGLILRNHTFNIGYSLFIKELQINLSVDAKKSADVLLLFNGQETASVAIKPVILPLLKEFSFEVKRFLNLVADTYHTPLAQIHLINDGFRFMYLPLYLQESLSIPSNLLNPYTICKKSSLVDSYKSSLPLFIPTIGGNLR